MSTTITPNVAEEVSQLRNKFTQIVRDLADLRARTARLSEQVEDLKKWAATLPKP